MFERKVRFSIAASLGSVVNRALLFPEVTDFRATEN